MLKYNAYYGANRERRTNLTREEIVNWFNIKGNGKDELNIYCPSQDRYVDNYFMPQFYDLQSNFAKLMFDDGAQLLEKITEGTYKWSLNGEIVISSPSQITYNLKTEPQ